MRVSSTLCLVVAVCLIISGTVSFADAVPKSDFPRFAQLAVNCELAGSNKFDAIQTGEVKDKLFSISFDDCNVQIRPNGATTIGLNTTVELSPSGNVQFCGSFSTALLFEVSSKTASFAWPEERTLLEDLDIENVYGDRKSLGLFHLHSTPSTEKTNLDGLFGSLNGMPRFDNIFWGRAIVLQANAQSDFVKMLRAKLPIEGSPEGATELTVNMKVTAYMPRGLCSYTTGETSTSVPPRPISFQATK